MAKFDFCSVAFEARCAMDEGRLADAKRIVVEHLQFDHCLVCVKECEGYTLGEKITDQDEIIKLRTVRDHFVAIKCPPIEELAAELLLIKKQKRAKGVKRKKFPPHWLNIGNDFLELRAGGLTPTQARRQLSKRYGYSDTSIRTALDRHEEANEEHSRIVFEEAGVRLAIPTKLAAE